VPRSAPTDGFSLTYDRTGSGPPVLLLHGWPGARTDYREVVPLLADAADLVVPDLRGFGESDKHVVAPAEGYSADAQARSLLGLMDELGLDDVVVAGYDVGSRTAQTLARTAPGRLRSLVLTPPLPGVGTRVLSPEGQREFWYQAFHQLDLAERLVDGKPDAVRDYLRYFWEHWSGPRFVVDEGDLDRLAAHYEAPGAFGASIGWYRAGGGTIARAPLEKAPAPQDRIAVPTRVLWPEHDPLFPREWADRLGEFFSDVAVTPVDGVGHYVPLEAPEAFAGAVREAVGRGA
jgi:pimeloyl-ACP methyl ester carboxylesterase